MISSDDSILKGIVKIIDVEETGPACYITYYRGSGRDRTTHYAILFTDDTELPVWLEAEGNPVYCRLTTGYDSSARLILNKPIEE